MYLKSQKREREKKKTCKCGLAQWLSSASYPLVPPISCTKNRKKTKKTGWLTVVESASKGHAKSRLFVQIPLVLFPQHVSFHFLILYQFPLSWYYFLDKLTSDINNVCFVFVVSFHFFLLPQQGYLSLSLHWIIDLLPQQVLFVYISKYMYIF